MGINQLKIYGHSHLCHTPLWIIDYSGSSRKYRHPLTKDFSFHKSNEISYLYSLIQVLIRLLLQICVYAMTDNLLWQVQKILAMW